MELQQARADLADDVAHLLQRVVLEQRHGIDSGASAWRIARARSSGAMRRGLRLANTKPMPSTPSSQARRTSPVG